LYGKELSFRCDCGGANHLNAFASGRGILNILRSRAEFAWGRAPDSEILRRFTEGIQNADRNSIAILDAATAPLAETLAILLTHDPVIGTIVLTGSVVHQLEPEYTASLNRQFLHHGLFLITDSDPNYLKRRLTVDTPDDSSGLIGARYLVEAHRSERPVYVND
jgi:glucokinase